MSGDEPQATGLEFPCEYPVKAMGRSGKAFRVTVIEIIERHTGPVDDDQVRTRSSSGGKFESVTITVRVETRTQLETLYQALADHEDVLWTL